MDPETRSRNLFFLILIAAAIAVGAFKLFLYRSALAESFQGGSDEEVVDNPGSEEVVSQP